MPRPSGRANDQLRPVEIEVGVQKFAEGSCLITVGDTRMLCTATVEDRVPGFLRGKGQGWLTAEYSMLPRSGRERNERGLMKPNGRTMEIQRLIGRSLRTAVDLKALGERTITIDCDAIQADGGTRCAGITGAWVALHEAVEWMNRQRMLKSNPLREPIAAVSVGVYRGEVVLDLDYAEDSQAGTDMNVVMTASGKFVEVQGTAEEEPYDIATLGTMLKVAKKGIDELIGHQREALGL